MVHSFDIQAEVGMFCPLQYLVEFIKLSIAELELEFL